MGGEWAVGDVGVTVDPVYICGDGYLGGSHLAPRTMFTVIEVSDGFYQVMVATGQTCWLLAGGPARAERVSQEL